jgi:hypothetical protein
MDAVIIGGGIGGQVAAMALKPRAPLTCTHGCNDPLNLARHLPATPLAVMTVYDAL